MPTLANKRNEYLDKTYDEDLKPLGPVEEQEEHTGPPSGESEALKFSEEEHANQPPPEEEKDRGLVTLPEVILSTDSWTENPLDLLQYLARAPRAFRETVESLPLTLKKGRPKALRSLRHGLSGVAKGGVYAVVGDWLATNFAVPVLASAWSGDEWTPKDVDAATDLAFTEAWRAFQDVGGVHPDKKIGKGHFRALWEQALAGGDMQAYVDSIDPIAREIRLLQKREDRKNPLVAARERRKEAEKKD